ncbi:hypothetical protein HZS_2359 [Henneguya salminicola]|uniref:Dosage compensation protein dpy-30 (Trinotate prediction) n=1 Tax=Henneguya salminicola TaxID=69463 RepID=A0A6G3MMU3_HENSL|nr:hypothetical protein HZS_2359 [Henneguya salminicola]
MAKNESIQNYLDEFLTPILLDALKIIVKNRPKDPVDFLINYLFQFKSSQNTTNPTIGLPIYASQNYMPNFIQPATYYVPHPIYSQNIQYSTSMPMLEGICSLNPLYHPPHQ